MSESTGTDLVLESLEKLKKNKKNIEIVQKEKSHLYSHKVLSSM